MGGEKSAAPFSWTFVTGSPPRGRGKGLLIGPGQLNAGITPAWAGKSFFPQRVQVRVQDHPRVGGEKISIRSVYQSLQGSPPRGRGKAAAAALDAAPAGITPAWAGKRNHALTVR